MCRKKERGRASTEQESGCVGEPRRSSEARGIVKHEAASTGARRRGSGQVLSRGGESARSCLTGGGWFIDGEGAG